MDLDTHDDLELDFDSEQDMDSDGTLGGSDGDDKQSIDNVFDNTARPLFQSFVRHELEAMYTNRYEAHRNQHPHEPSLMQFTLKTYKTLQPDFFQQDLHVFLDTFNKIIEKILDHPVFFNNSNHPQAPVEDQLAVMLFCFGHYSNAASLERVRKLAGVLKGTVKLATCRVMTAVLSPDFMKDAVRLLTDEEKEDAKLWVEEHSCKAWHDGWCLVDGTLMSPCCTQSPQSTEEAIPKMKEKYL